MQTVLKSNIYFKRCLVISLVKIIPLKSFLKPNPIHRNLNKILNTLTSYFTSYIGSYQECKVHLCFLIWLIFKHFFDFEFQLSAFREMFFTYFRKRYFLNCFQAKEAQRTIFHLSYMFINTCLLKTVKFFELNDSNLNQIRIKWFRVKKRKIL